SFKAPTEEERAQDFLWRIRRALPGPGKIGIFDRSHYEDVLIQRVESMASPDEIERRYGAINEFEAELVGSGITVVKCFLNVSKATQRERLLARLDNPDKYYKYNTSDVDTALKYDDYMAAYSIAMTRCNTAAAPWYVIPADRKWYRNWAIAHVLLETLEGLRLGWPGADFDVDAERARVEALPTE
ncbi:MAG: polyphosphate kinase 2 family protein, partial [Brooklawnia sp.]